MGSPCLRKGVSEEVASYTEAAYPAPAEAYVPFDLIFWASLLTKKGCCRAARCGFSPGSISHAGSCLTRVSQCTEEMR